MEREIQGNPCLQNDMMMMMLVISTNLDLHGLPRSLPRFSWFIVLVPIVYGLSSHRKCSKILLHNSSRTFVQFKHRKCFSTGMVFGINWQWSPVFLKTLINFRSLSTKVLSKNSNNYFWRCLLVNDIDYINQKWCEWWISCGFAW